MPIDPYRMIYVNLVYSILVTLGVVIYKYVYPKKKPNLLILLILISIGPIISIFRTGTYESGDLTLHSVFLRSFYENLSQGIFLPQWGGGLCAGYGCPVFLFEYLLPYYLGAPFHFLGFSFINSIKIVLALVYILSGVGMYLWIKEEFGKVAGFTAAIFYLFAPFHLEDMHFRVSVGMVASFFPMPFLFLYTKKTIENKGILNIILGGIFLALLILAHTSITLAILPVLLGYALITWFHKKKRKILDLLKFLSSITLGLLLTFYYWLPALSEVKYTWYVKGFENFGDFKPFIDYLISPTRFGFLFQGNHGELRPIVGYPHLFVVLLGIYIAYTNRAKLKSKTNLLLLFMITSFFLYFFLMLSISKPVWEALPILKTFIIVWRFLIPIAFVTSVISAIIVKKYPKNKFIIALCLITIFSTILNWGNRKMVPEDPNAYENHWSLYTEYVKPNDIDYIQRVKTRIPLIPALIRLRPLENLNVLTGKANIKELRKMQTKHEYIVDASTDTLIKENTFYFPGWSVTANNHKVKINYENKNYFGVITFPLRKGLYKVTVEFKDTPVRYWSKIVSLLALITIIVLVGKDILDYILKKSNRFSKVLNKIH